MGKLFYKAIGRMHSAALGVQRDVREGMEGQGFVEYAILVAGIAIVCLVAVTAFGGGVKCVFEKVTTQLGTWNQ